MEQKLINFIKNQRAEAEAFTAAAPGNFMGMLPCHTDTEYWSERVPSGTFAEFERIQLEESAYYLAADAMSKSYARFISPKLSDMTDGELHHFCDQMSMLMEADAA